MERKVTTQISKTANMLKRKMAKVGYMNGLSYAQAKVFCYILNGEGEVFQQDIEKEFMLRPSTATVLLKSLEHAGLIKRIASPYDSRKKGILPTEKGLPLKEETEREMDQMEKYIIQGISEDELETFFRITDRMITNMQKENSLP